MCFFPWFMSLGKNSLEVEKNPKFFQPSVVVQQIIPNENFYQDEIATHFYSSSFYVLPNYSPLKMRKGEVARLGKTFNVLTSIHTCTLWTCSLWFKTDVAEATIEDLRELILGTRSWACQIHAWPAYSWALIPNKGMWIFRALEAFVQLPRLHSECCCQL